MKAKQKAEGMCPGSHLGLWGERTLLSLGQLHGQAERASCVHMQGPEPHRGPHPLLRLSGELARKEDGTKVETEAP